MVRVRPASSRPFAIESPTTRRILVFVVVQEFVPLAFPLQMRSCRLSSRSGSSIRFIKKMCIIARIISFFRRASMAGRPILFFQYARGVLRLYELPHLLPTARSQRRACLCAAAYAALPLLRCRRGCLNPCPARHLDLVRSALPASHRDVRGHAVSQNTRVFMYHLPTRLCRPHGSVLPGEDDDGATRRHSDQNASRQNVVFEAGRGGRRSS